MSDVGALSPRKTPLQARARRTVATILEGAAHILARDGLEGFNTNAVAERAGVSVGSLYQYFPHKDALMAALIADAQEKILARVEEAAAASAGAPLAEAVAMLVRAGVAHHAESARVAAALDYEEERLPVDAVVKQHAARMDELIAAFLAERRSAVRAPDLEVAARTVRVIAKAVVDAYAGARPSDAALAEREATRAILGYLTSDAPSG